MLKRTADYLHNGDQHYCVSERAEAAIRKEEQERFAQGLYIWLGYWRDYMDATAVESLQNKIEKISEVTE